MNRITVSMLMGVVALMATSFAPTASADCFMPCGAILCSHPAPLVGIGEGPIVLDASGGHSVRLEQMHWSDEEGLSVQLVPFPGSYVLGEHTRVLAFLVRQDGNLVVSEALRVEGTNALCENSYTKISVESAVEMATSKKCVEKAESKGLYPECNDTESIVSCSAAGTSHGTIALVASALALALGLGERKRRRGSV